MKWKVCGRKRPWPNVRYHPGICLEEPRKTTKILSTDSRSPGQHLKPGPPESEAGAVTTRPRRSVRASLRKQRTEKCVCSNKHSSLIVIYCRSMSNVALRYQTSQTQKYLPSCFLRSVDTDKLTQCYMGGDIFDIDMDSRYRYIMQWHGSIQSLTSLEILRKP
jgi:hypothetical protein